MNQPMQVLVVGGTGTVGRQIARTAIDAGHQVRCIVRSPRKASFLQEWGCEIIQGDLLDKRSIKDALKDIQAVIDAATSRPDDPKGIYQIDWEGKLNLYNSCEELGINRVVFLSLLAAEDHRNVPLMDIKYCTEKLLENSSLDYTILQGVAFMQGVIGQFAIPVLENQTVWISGSTSQVAYMNTQDMAKFAVSSLRRDQTIRKSFPIVGPKAWKADEIVKLCERSCGKTKPAKVLRVSKFLIELTQKILSFFEPSLSIADRLAFSEVTGGEVNLNAPMKETYEAFGLNPEETSTLEGYLREYYSIIMKRMRELEIDVDKEEKRRVPF